MSKPPSTSPFKNDILRGRVAFVTGGGSGIGLEIAIQFGLHGASVCILGRRADALSAAVAVMKQKHGIVNCMGVAGDVRNAQDVERALNQTVDAYGYINVVVNCAAGNFLCSAEDLTPNGLRTIMEIDTIGTFNVCRAAFPHLIRHTRPTTAAPEPYARTAAIINISATLQSPATWYQLGASAAKAGVDSMTRSLALEWGEFGIAVNCIAPGPIADTPGMTKLSGGTSDDLLKSIIPMGRAGTKFEVALMAIYLASDAGHYISGNTSIVVDGAANLWRPPMADRDTIRTFSRKIEKTSRATGLAEPLPLKSKL